ncbi:MAG: sigma-70 family RNA polymerase sigma factor [Phycisphaerales bacterium]|nr:sigma-70 family RNA polymerase sigma factor [Phycisphaerales bacterium]
MDGDLDNPLPRNTPEPASATPGQVTALANAASLGDAQAANQLFQLVYDQLRAIARQRMGAGRPGQTLQATALVNEACIRLLGPSSGPWKGRKHFFGTAALAMRQILIDHARSKNADKRGGGMAALSISNIADVAGGEDPTAFLALDDAILRLERVDAMAAAVVRLRFYAGLEPTEVAATLGISERSARREWSFARGWLRDALEHDAG